MYFFFSLVAIFCWCLRFLSIFPFKAGVATAISSQRYSSRTAGAPQQRRHCVCVCIEVYAMYRGEWGIYEWPMARLATNWQIVLLADLNNWLVHTHGAARIESVAYMRDIETWLQLLLNAAYIPMHSLHYYYMYTCFDWQSYAQIHFNLIFFFIFAAAGAQKCKAAFLYI